MTNIIDGAFPQNNTLPSQIKSYSVIDELESLGLINSSLDTRLLRARTRKAELGFFDKSTGEISAELTLLHSGYVISFQVSCDVVSFRGCSK